MPLVSLRGATVHPPSVGVTENPQAQEAKGLSPNLLGEGSLDKGRKGENFLKKNKNRHELFPNLS